MSPVRIIHNFRVVTVCVRCGLRVFYPPFFHFPLKSIVIMASGGATGTTTGQPNLHEQDLAKLVRNF